MTIKERVISSLKSLPNDATWEDVRERIEFMAGIRKGLKELDEGRGIPHARIEKESSSWISK